MHVWEYGLPTAFNIVEINHQLADALPLLCSVHSAAGVGWGEIVDVSFASTHFVIQDLQALAISNGHVQNLGNAPVKLGDQGGLVQAKEGAVAAAVVYHGVYASVRFNNGAMLEFDARQAHQFVEFICAQHAGKHYNDRLNQTQCHKNVTVVGLDRTACGGYARCFVAKHAQAGVRLACRSRAVRAAYRRFSDGKPGAGRLRIYAGCGHGLGH